MKWICSYNLAQDHNQVSRKSIMKRARWLLSAALGLSIGSHPCVGTPDSPISKEKHADTITSARTQWRGPRGDGVITDLAAYPTTWSTSENIRWRVPLPGRGHASATVVNDRVYLPAAEDDREVQSVRCYDRSSGNELWECVVHQGGFKNASKRQMNEKASLASSTIAADGELLFVNFLNDNAVWTSAINAKGEIVWQTRICDYMIHQGYGSSPTIFESLVIVSADNRAGGAVAGLDRETGDVVWKHERPKKPNYSSPVVHDLAGKKQLILTGCDLVTSLDPHTGQVLWETEGATTECVTTTPTDGVHVFSSGGYPENHIAAYMADGSAKQVWKQGLRAYVPSLLHRDRTLYAVLDAGIATSLDSKTGEVLWKKRLGGTFSSSPVLVGDQIYVTSEDGKTHIFAADPEQFEGVAVNQLGTSVFATPTFSGGQIFMRIAEQTDSGRQESLVCIDD